MSEVVNEWRVTGEPGEGFPPYVFVFRSDDDRWPGEAAEVEAKEFVRKVSPWEDGPFLHHRTVTYTTWEQS